MSRLTAQNKRLDSSLKKVTHDYEEASKVRAELENQNHTLQMEIEQIKTKMEQLVTKHGKQI